MSILIATTDTEINACYPVMSALRPHIAADDFLSRVRNQQAAGYQLAYMQVEDTVVAVAGYRLSENLAWGKFLYVDDLVTHPEYRTRGYGKALLAWLKQHAGENGCRQIHLDSGTQREGAHRFYKREDMTLSAYHFTDQIPLVGD